MSNDLPAHMRPERSFQGLILALQRYWAEHGCVILQPYDMEVGAGTFHPATTLRALGPNPWNAVYVQPSRRPKDGRYGENPNRLQHYYQFQVILKPSPDDIQDLYLKSLYAIGIDPKLHDSALSRTTGNRRRWAPGGSAGNAGAMAWKSRSSPISSRSPASNARRCRASSPMVSSGWRCTCRASTASLISTSTAAKATERSPTATSSFRRRRNIPGTISSSPRPRCCFEQFKMAEAACRKYIDAGWATAGNDKRHLMALPAYDQCIKASHVFNLLDARGVISVTERQSYILRVRELAKACGEAWLATEAARVRCLSAPELDAHKWESLTARRRFEKLRISR
jgi:glycyl-tRNA synthetase alpha chain